MIFHIFKVFVFFFEKISGAHRIASAWYELIKMKYRNSVKESNFRSIVKQRDIDLQA